MVPSAVFGRARRKRMGRLLVEVSEVVVDEPVAACTALSKWTKQGKVTGRQRPRMGKMTSEEQRLCGWAPMVLMPKRSSARDPPEEAEVSPEEVSAGGVFTGMALSGTGAFGAGGFGTTADNGRGSGGGGHTMAMGVVPWSHDC